MRKFTAETTSLRAALNFQGITEEWALKIAQETGFQKRSARKITPLQLVCLVFSEALSGHPSYNDLASRLDTDEGIDVSRQAIWKRFNSNCQLFFERILAFLIAAQTGTDKVIPREHSREYKRVIIQDSTVIRLPARLFEEYSGVANGNQAVCNARIQVVYDVLAEQFISFSIDPYSKNDLKAAPELVLQPGDLVLRDRGYLITDEIQRHLDMGADCIYRHKHKTSYIDPETETPLDLAALLERHDSLDIEVCLNNKTRTPVRLVAAPVDEETANLRRMKLKKEAHGHSPSAENLKLMSWTIFVTTVDKATLSFEELLACYGIRWRIETIFKVWKSNMHFAAVHNVSAIQLRVILTARLAMAVVLTTFVYKPARARIRSIFGRELSLFKVIRYVTKTLHKLPEILVALHKTEGSDPVLNSLAKYCSYDKRKRRNFNLEMERLMTELALG